MAERPGGRSGRGARSQFRLGASGGFLSGLYPYRGDIMDVGQASQTTAALSASDFVSPSKGTRTRTVREYEQTISDLKKENFDLKLRVYLLEEAMNKNRGNTASSPSAKDNTVHVMVQMQLESESLRNELSYKDKLLQDAMEQSEKFAADLKEWEEKHAQLQALLSELPSQEEYSHLLEEREDLLRQNEALRSSVEERTEDLNAVNHKLEILADRNNVLEEKLHRRNMALQGFVYKNYQEKEALPDALRHLVVTAAQAARDRNQSAVSVAVKSIQAALNQIMCSPVRLDVKGKENRRSSPLESARRSKCLTQESLPKHLGCQSEGHIDLSAIQNLRGLLSETQSSHLESFVQTSLQREATSASEQQFGEKETVDLMNFSSAPLVSAEQTHISSANAYKTELDWLSVGGVIDIQNIFSPLASPVVSPLSKNVSTSSLHPKSDASASVSVSEDRNISVPLRECMTSVYKSEDESSSVSLHRGRNASASVSLCEDKGVLTSTSLAQPKSASTSVSYPNINVGTSVSHTNIATSPPVSWQENKDVSTLVSLQFKNASVSTSCPNADVSTSVSHPNMHASTSVSQCTVDASSSAKRSDIDVSTSVSRLVDKDASTSVSPLHSIWASTSVSHLQSKNVSTSNSLQHLKNTSTSVSCQNTDAFTSVSHPDIDASTYISRPENKDMSTSVSLQFKNASTLVSYPTMDAATSTSQHENKDASTSVSLLQCKNASTSVSYPNIDASTSALLSATDASTSISPLQCKNASTSALLSATDASTSISPLQCKNASTSVSSQNIDASTSVSHLNLDDSLSMHKSVTSVPVCERRDSSVSTSGDQLQKLHVENERLKAMLEEKLDTIQSLTESSRAAESLPKPSLCSACTQTEMLEKSVRDVSTAAEPEKCAVADTFRDESQANLNEDYLCEKSELHERLAFSCSVNMELMRHLQSLEQFLEDLLQHKLDTSSLENISGQSGFLANLSKCLNESLKLSNVLSDHLSICEGSRLFEECKSMLYKSGSFSEEKSLPQMDFSELNLPDISFASDRRNSQPPVKITHQHLSYPSSDSDIWSEPDRDISLQRIGINLQPSPMLTKSPRKLRSKEKRIPGRYSTDRDTSSSEVRPLWSRHHRQTGSACRRLFEKDHQDFSLDKYCFLLAEKFANLKSILSSLQNIKDEAISVPMCSKMNSFVASLGEALQKLERAKELNKGSSSPLCGKCALLELLMTLKTCFGIQETSLSQKSKILARFQREISELREACEEPFPLLFSMQEEKSTQSNPALNPEQEKESMGELAQVIEDLNHKNEKLARKYDMVQNMLQHEKDVAGSMKTDNLLMSREINRLKEEVGELNGKNQSLLKNLDEVQNLLVQERNTLESIKAENELLSNEIKHLKTEIANLKEEKNVLSLQNSELDKLLASAGKENSELNEVLKVLEQKKTESDDALNQLSAELQKNKSELVNMSIKCVELEKELGKEIKIKEDFSEKLTNLELLSATQKQECMNEIKNLETERNKCMEKLENMQNKMFALEKEISFLNDRLNAKDYELSSMLKNIEILQHDKEALTAICTELQSALELAKEQQKSLQQKNSSYEKEVSEKLVACQMYHQELQNLEAKLLSEKNELTDKISLLVSEKNDILQQLQSEVAYSEKLMAEKIEMDNKLAESCQQIALLRSVEEEKYELTEKLSLLISERENILQEINHEKELTEALMAEKRNLNCKLAESHQQIDELKRAYSALTQKNEQIQSVLLTSDSHSVALGNELKDMREIVLKVEAKCAAYEKDLVASSGLKVYVIECLLSIRNELITARQKMAEICSAYDDDFVECDETPIPDFKPVTDENVTTLCDLVSCENKKVLKTVDVLVNVLKMSRLKSQKKHPDRENVSTAKEAEIQKHKLEHLKTQNDYLQKMVEEKQKSLSENEKSVKFSALEIQSLKERVQNSGNEIEKGKLLLKMKEDETTRLQERIFNLQTYINSMLGEKSDTQRKATADNLEKSVQVDSISTSFPVADVSLDKVFQAEEFSGSADENLESAEYRSSSKASCCRKYQNKCSSLQTKLLLLQKRIEILEGEKNNLREFQANHLSSLESAKMCDLESKLEQKKVFIAELKAELMKVCNSLIDKEREVDELKLKLSGCETKLKLTVPDTTKHRLMAEPKVPDMGANIANLKKYKWKLIQTIFEVQRNVYEKKGIHLSYFDKFTDHLDALYSFQVVHPLTKSESLPVLGIHAEIDAEAGRSIKQLLMELELDIECLEKIKIFLSRFFVPSVLQKVVPTEPTSALMQDFEVDPGAQTDSSQKTSDFISALHNNTFPGKLEPTAKAEKMNREKAKYFEVFQSSLTDVPTSHEDILENYSSVKSYASSVSRRLDFLENFFRAAKEYKKLNILDNADDDEDEREARSLLFKILKEMNSLYKKADLLFSMNALLKSLGCFPTHISKTADASDRESVLSEETITMSRSGTPLSSEDNKSPTKGYVQPLESVPRSKVAVLSSSFESLHHRSQYSSPDLGIESDPNHESSVPEHKDSKTLSKYQKLEDRKSASPEKTDQWRGGALLLGGDSLYCVGQLPHYELLKREVQESLVGIKSILSRTGDGLRHIATYTSPRKTLEYSTMRAIKDSCANVEVCLKEAYKLIGKFWIAPCPSEQEWNSLIEENQKLTDEISRLRMLMENQESDFKKAVGKLEHAELLKANMEKKISKKLVKTKKVIRQAQLKLLETGCQNCPPLPKYPPSQKET